MIATWEAGKLYLPGALVVPVNPPTPTYTALVNGGLESGTATGWQTLPGAVSVDTTPAPYAGTYVLKFTGTGGTIRAVSNRYAVSPGTSVTANAMYKQGSAGVNLNVGRVILVWYTSALAEISESQGTLVNRSGATGWKPSTVTAIAPTNAAYVSIGGRVIRDNAAVSAFDNFNWSLVGTSSPQGLMYRAANTTPGTSGDQEPAWPGVLGQTVLDGEVTWEAIRATRIVWQAFPLLKSSGVQPTWPTVPGDVVLDGTVTWEATTRNITDVNCPNTTSVVIMASKVFAVDGDIVRFSATANPLDWTTESDAGYLPTGLQQANANDMIVLNQYRGNLVAMNASSFQMWQVDPDPTGMALLDQMEGIGSVHQKAAQPVANDLVYLSQLGVRSIGIAAATENMQSGDLGAPIDLLIRAAVSGTINAPIATYYPGAGQYWIAFPEPSSGTTYQNPVAASILAGTGTGAAIPLLWSDMLENSGATAAERVANNTGTYPGTAGSNMAARKVPAPIGNYGKRMIPNAADGTWFPHTVPLTVTGNISICGWMLDGGTAADQKFFNRVSGLGVTNGNILSKTGATTHRFQATMAAGSPFTVGPANISGMANSVWHYWTYVRNGNTHSLYVDGVNLGTEATAGGNNGAMDNSINPVYWCWGGQVYDTNSVDAEDSAFSQAQVFGGALTQAQIDYLYNGGAGRTWDEFSSDAIAATFSLSAQTPPPARVGAAYSWPMRTRNGRAPITITLTSGTLPAGLSLASGVVTGTATADEAQAVTFRAVDADGRIATQALTFYSSSTVALLNCNGTNASTVFTDEVGQRHWTPSGNAQISTAESKFGGASAFFDGTSDHVQAQLSQDYNLSAGNFTVRCWARLSTFAVDPQAGVRRVWTLATAENSGTYGHITIYANVATGNRFGWGATTSVGTLIFARDSVGTYSIDTWYHLEMVRSGAVWYLFVNGVLDDTVTPGVALSNVPYLCRLGANPQDATWGNLSGYIDDFEIKKGVALHTSNFTPPAAQLTFP